MTTFTGMSVNLECEIHKKKFEKFCKTHDEPVCAACISSKHKTCVDTISLEAAAKNAKKSAALTNVKEIIDETTRNIEFGVISVKETNTGLSLEESKINQAQIHVPKIQTVSDVKLELRQKFQIKNEEKSMWISGCVILLNNHVLIADCLGKTHIMEYSDKGEHVRDIPVSSVPFDLTLIDNDRVAVSYTSNDIEIININNNIVEKKIKLGGNCHGISYQDAKLYILLKGQGITVVDTTGRTLNTINCDVSAVEYLKTTKDRIYYTDFDNDTIHCCSSTAEEIWVFQDDSVRGPAGISVDNNQNVFIVGADSHNLTIIQHDGKSFKTLLTKFDGLEDPEVVCYSNGKKLLFTANRYNGNAGFYQVI